MKTHNITIHDTTSLDEQLEESMQEVYSKLETPMKVAMTIWLKLYELPKVENVNIRLLKSELETLEEEIRHLRKNRRASKQKEEEYGRLLEEFNAIYKKSKEENTIEKHITSKYHIILNDMDKKDFLGEIEGNIKNKVSELCFKKSGLTIDEITKHVLTEVLC